MAAMAPHIRRRIIGGNSEDESIARQLRSVPVAARPERVKELLTSLM